MSGLFFFTTVLATITIIVGCIFGTAMLVDRRHQQLLLTQEPQAGEVWSLYGVGRVQIREVTITTRELDDLTMQAKQVNFVPLAGPFESCWMPMDNFMDRASREVRQHQSIGRLDRVRRMRERMR